jgi:SNF2 family DNA or RNA helicase
MRVAECNDGKINISFPYDPTLVDQIKLFPAYCRRWNPKQKLWVFNLDVSNKSEIIENLYVFLEKNQFTITQSVTKALGKKDSTVKTKNEIYDASFDTDATIEVDILQHELRPFQKAGVVYLSKQKKCFLADEMGLGKTVQALASTANVNGFPCLIICPVSLQKNWKKEIIKWFDEWCSVDEKPNRNADFNIIPYSQIKKYKDILESIAYKTIICDESHYLKNSSAARTKQVKELSKNCENVFLLSGTPILSRPSELISQLEIINRLGELGGWQYFTKNYCAAYKGRFGLNISGAKNLDILNQELRKRCYIRRQKKDVLKELPDKQRIVIDVELSNPENYANAEIEVLEEIQQRKEQYKEEAEMYNYIISENPIKYCKDFIRKDFKNPSREDLINLNKCKSKKDISIFVKNYFNRKSENIENAEALMLLNKLKQRCATEKIDSCISWIEEFMLNGNKLIIFADNISIQKGLLDRLSHFSPASVLGEMSAEERQNNVDNFQTNDQSKIIVCSLQAAGVGITLTSASDVVFIQCGWTPALHDQAEDRAHRIGQENAVTCYYLLAPNTIDTDIWNLIESKREVVGKASEGQGRSSKDYKNILTSIQSRIDMH